MTAKRITDITLIGFTALAVLALVAWTYFMIFNNREAIGLNFVGDQTGIDAQAPESGQPSPRWFMEVNVLSNANDNGMALQELRFNYFTSHDLAVASYRSTGMQYVGRYRHNPQPYSVVAVTEMWGAISYNISGSRSGVDNHIAPNWLTL